KVSPAAVPGLLTLRVPLPSSRESRHQEKCSTAATKWHQVFAALNIQGGCITYVVDGFPSPSQVPPQTEPARLRLAQSLQRPPKRLEPLVKIDHYGERIEVRVKLSFRFQGTEPN